MVGHFSPTENVDLVKPAQSKLAVPISLVDFFGEDVSDI